MKDIYRITGPQAQQNFTDHFGFLFVILIDLLMHHKYWLYSLYTIIELKLQTSALRSVQVRHGIFFSNQMSKAKLPRGVVVYVCIRSRTIDV